MLTKTPHLFDDATRVTAGDSRWQGKTSPDYWAFVGPFGGCTAATILRALIDHPQRAGDPLSLTVNFCAPIARRGVRSRRPPGQGQPLEPALVRGDDARRRRRRDAGDRRVRRAPPVLVAPAGGFPGATPFEQTRPYPNTPMTWTQQYDFRFVEGEPKFYGSPASSPLDAYSKQWIGDRVPRKIDMLSLMSMSDAFFGRIFLARRELMPFGTVSITTYFHAASDDLAAEDITRVLAVADAKIFHKSYGDQNGELWSPSGRLLATTTQIAYFKA